jgi:ATP-dependent DNA helicase RecQ
MKRRTAEQRRNKAPLRIHTLERKAREIFGIPELHPGQREVLDAVMRERNVLAIMPAGSGKSLCYQLSALALPGIAVVVSPLLALMKDQSDQLNALGFKADVINGMLRVKDRTDRFSDISEHRSEFVFTTPEQLTDPEFISNLRQANISLVVIDEAHCISEWGHDFRPSYSMLGGALKALDRPGVLALTATATPQVIEDIKRQLGIESLFTIDTGVYRPNLYYEVLPRTNAEEKQEAVHEIIRALDGAGLIYCATIKNVETLFTFLKTRGLSLSRYHGRLPAAERNKTQDRFMSGDLRLIVATNAFGMGINRPDIRSVIHYDTPGSIEAYYQESGRAGRDGNVARCILLYRLEDRRTQTFFLGGAAPNIDEIATVCDMFQRLHASEFPITLNTIQQESGLGRQKAGIAVSILKNAELIRQERGSRFRWVSNESAREYLETIVNDYRERRELDRDKLERMMLYGQLGSCRWKYLLDYFGEAVEWSNCGHCDNCQSPPETWIGNEHKPTS